METDNSPNAADIAATWISYQLWQRTRPDPDSSGGRRTLAEFRAEDAESDRHGFWAVEAVNRLVREDREYAWLVILRLVELAPDDLTLAAVAAGPLENLLGSHSYEVIERVEHQAQTDIRFRRCLSGVWGWSSIPEDVQERMRRTWEGEEPL